MTSAEIEFIRKVQLFQDVEEPVLRALWPSFRERLLRRGDVLFRTGDPGEELFLLKEGSIVVSKPSPDGSSRCWGGSSRARPSAR